MFLASQPQNPQARHRCIAGSWGHPSLWSLLAAVPALRLRPWVVHHCHQRPLTQPRQEGYVEWWWWWWWRWLLRGFWRGFYRVNSMNATQKGSHGLKWSTRPWIPPSLLHAPKPSWKKGLRWPPPTKRHLRKINSCAVETSREEQISGATDTYISRNPKGTLSILWKQHSISMFCGNQQISWVLFQQGTLRYSRYRKHPTPPTWHPHAFRKASPNAWPVQLHVFLAHTTLPLLRIRLYKCSLTFLTPKIDDETTEMMTSPISHCCP